MFRFKKSHFNFPDDISNNNYVERCAQVTSRFEINVRSASTISPYQRYSFPFTHPPTPPFAIYRRFVIFFSLFFMHIDKWNNNNNQNFTFRKREKWRNHPCSHYHHITLPVFSVFSDLGCTVVSYRTPTSSLLDFFIFFIFSSF